LSIASTMRNSTQRYISYLTWAAIFVACAADEESDSDKFCEDGSHQVSLLQKRFALSAEGQWDVGSQVAPAQELYDHQREQIQPDPPRHSKSWYDMRFQIDNSSLQRFKVLPEVHSSCLSSSKGCPPKVAFMFLVISTLTQPAAWDAFFAKAPPDRFSIYVERKERDGVLPLLHHGAIEAEPVQTDWCALLGGMISLLQAAFADAQNEQFVFVSDDTIPLKSFVYIYESLVQKAPQSSNFCGVVDDPAITLDSSSPKFMTRFANGKVCGIGAGWHLEDERLWKAHQWSTLARGHAELILLHVGEAFELYTSHKCNVKNGCSDEVVPITALVAGLRAQGAPAADNWDDLVQVNITNRCPVLAAWPGPANCTTPSRPSDIGLTEFPERYCNIGDTGFMCEPYIFSSMELQHLRNLACSGFMFARKVTEDAEVVNGTEHLALSQVVLPDLWMESEGGACR